MSRITPLKRLSKDQNGMAAILITMVMMIVISLIVLGFAKIARREQRQSLDRQLSTQAFYAAESGVNAAIKFYAANATNIATTAKTACPPATGVVSSANPYVGIGGAGATPYNLDTNGGSSNVAVTCLLVDPAPTSLVYGSIGTTSQVVPITTGTGGPPLSTITLSWQDTTPPGPPGVPTFASCGRAANTSSLPPTTGATAWKATCGAGLLRVDLASGAAAVTDRSSLAANTFTAFLYPTTGGSNSTGFLSPSRPNPVVATKCTTAPVAPQLDCFMKITIPAALNSNIFYLRLQSFYIISTVIVQGLDGSGMPQHLADVQLQIDSTGRAVDVLRRIQVRKSLITVGATPPDTAVQSTSTVCKRFTIIPGSAPVPDSAYSADPLCTP